MPDITAIVMAVIAFLIGGVAGASILYFLPKKANPETSPNPSGATSPSAAKEAISGFSDEVPPKPKPNATLPVRHEYSAENKKDRNNKNKHSQSGQAPSVTNTSVSPVSAIPEGLVKVREALNQAKKRLNPPTERNELLEWLDSWIQQLEAAQAQIKDATPTLLAKDQLSTLDGLLRTLYQPKLPSTLPPQGDKAYMALLPILHGALRCCVTLAGDLDNKLGVEPILPRPGDTFDPVRHDGLATHRRKATDGQVVGTVYHLISPGLQKSGVSDGEVLLRAEVGIYESRS